MSGSSSDSTTTLIVDDLSQSLVFSPVGAWERSSQGQGLTGGTFTFSDTENATVTFHVPQNTTGFSWRGFLRSGPALFSVCIDCTSPGAATLVDGHAWNQQSTDVSTTLFTKTGLSNAAHTITITNLLDPRFGNVSQITVDDFIVSVETAQVAAPPSSMIPTPTSSSQPPPNTTDDPMPSSATVSSTVASSPSSSAPATTSQPSSTTFRSNASVLKKVPNGVTVGTACASVFGLLALFTLLWWVVRRKHVYGKVSNGGYYGARQPVGDVESSMTSTVRSSPSKKEESSVVQVGFPSWRTSGLGFNQSSSDIPRFNGSQTSHSDSENSSSSVLPQWGVIPLRLSLHRSGHAW